LLLTPNSWGVRPLREFNGCHEPDSGRFCSDGVTRVGITTFRPGRSTRRTFAEMRRLERRLSELPGVTHLQVKPAVGAWNGGWEPAFAIAYVGNGAARRLLGKFREWHQQDAVLLMKSCRGPNCDASAEFTFDTPVGRQSMEAVSELLAAEGFGGWTWTKKRGQTHLRTVSVPKWGGERQSHIARARQLSEKLQAVMPHRLRVRPVKTEVIDGDDT
jgi:hypothetical protein